MTKAVIVLVTAAAVALVWSSGDGWTPRPAVGGERAQAAGNDELSWSGTTVYVLQEDEGAGTENDQRVPVQVWTLVAAAGAGGIGLLLLLLRMAMGWVQQPPPPEESHH